MLLDSKHPCALHHPFFDSQNPGKLLQKASLGEILAGVLYFSSRVPRHPHYVDQMNQADFEARVNPKIIIDRLIIPSIEQKSVAVVFRGVLGL